MTTEQRLCLSSRCIFVCCNDGGGGKEDASQRGCRGRKCSFFSPGFLWSRESKASHVACAFVSRRSVRLKRPAACQTSPGLALSHGDHGGRCWAFLFCGDHRVLALTSAGDKVGVR